MSTGGQALIDYPLGELRRLVTPDPAPPAGDVGVWLDGQKYAV
jgi:hypothetical protein